MFVVLCAFSLGVLDMPFLSVLEDKKQALGFVARSRPRPNELRLVATDSMSFEQIRSDLPAISAVTVSLSSQSEEYLRVFQLSNLLRFWMPRACGR